MRAVIVTRSKPQYDSGINNLLSVLIDHLGWNRQQQGFLELSCFETAPFRVAKIVLFLPFLPEYLS